MLRYLDNKQLRLTKIQFLPNIIPDNITISKLIRN